MTFPSTKRLVTSVAVAALLAGCSGTSQSALSPTQSVPQAGRVVAQASKQIPSPVARPNKNVPVHRGGQSHMSPDAAKSKALLYVSNGDGTVTVFKYAGGNPTQQVGTLTGFVFPGAPCTDTAGNVFIPDYDLGTVTEYAYGASTPTQTLDPGGSAIACSVDPGTGNLAVVNYTTPSGSGNIAVYKESTGTPTIYTNPNQFYPEFAGYDNGGNLWISGRSTSLVVTIAYLKSGSGTITTATVNGATIFFPAQVQWGGTYLLVGDQEFGGVSGSGLYQMSVSGSTLTAAGSFPFAGSLDVLGFYKRGSTPNATVAAPDNGLSEGLVYKFPNGQQTGSFPAIGSYGAAIAQKR
jgi:hypothetical protein